MHTAKRKLVTFNLVALLAVGSVAGYAVTATAASAASSSSASASNGNGRTTGASSPEKLLELLGERIVAQDVDGIIALHEPGAAIVDWDGSVIRGHDAIREFYVDWFALDPVLTVNPQQVIEAGGKSSGNGKTRVRTASVMGSYHLEQDGEDGERISFTGNFCDVVQQQTDGTWLYVLDNPYPPHGDPASVSSDTSSHHSSSGVSRSSASHH